MALNEFQCIERFFDALTPDNDSVVVPIGDDATILQVPEGEQLVVTTDTLIAGTHFFEDTPPHAIGHKCLAVNLSDLAAMGARPRFVLLALTLPSVDEAWLGEFTRGFAELAKHYGVALVGGDLTKGPLSLTVQALGTVPKGEGLLRRGAKGGDKIFVSGGLGAAAKAVEDKQHTQALDYPIPRIELGLALRGVARCCIDISDGLVADCGHLCEKSDVSAEIFVNKIPLGKGAEIKHALAGGDDYELCFTLPPEKVALVESIANATGCVLTEIGEMVSGGAVVTVLNSDDSPYDLDSIGFRHF